MSSRPPRRLAPRASSMPRPSACFGYPFVEKVRSPPYLPVDQNHPVGAQDAYGLSKWLGEEIVDAAVRRGAFSAVSLRMPWIQTPETFFDERGSAPRHWPIRARDLWSYLDARDAGRGLPAGARLEGRGASAHLPQRRRQLFTEEETAALCRRAYPGVPFCRGRSPVIGSVLDMAHARETLGFEPRHSWRSYKNPEETNDESLRKQGRRRHRRRWRHRRRGGAPLPRRGRAGRHRRPRRRRAEAFAAELGERALAIAADVSDEAEVRARDRQRPSTTFGRLDVVFNNAGISGQVAPVHELAGGGLGRHRPHQPARHLPRPEGFASAP